MDDDTAPTIGARDLVGRLIGRSAPEDGPVLQAALDEYRATARRSDDRRRMLRAIIARVGRPLVRDVLEEAAAERWGWSGARECTELFEGSDSLRDVEARVAGTRLLVRVHTGGGDRLLHVDLRDVLHVGNALTGLFKFRSTDGRRAETLRGSRYMGAWRDADAPAARRWRYQSTSRGPGVRASHPTPIVGEGRTPTEAIRAYLDAAQAAEAAAAPAGDGAAPSLRTFIADEMDREAAAAPPAAGARGARPRASPSSTTTTTSCAPASARGPSATRPSAPRPSTSTERALARRADIHVARGGQRAARRGRGARGGGVRATMWDALPEELRALVLAHRAALTLQRAALRWLRYGHARRAGWPRVRAHLARIGAWPALAPYAFARREWRREAASWLALDADGARKILAEAAEDGLWGAASAHGARAGADARERGRDECRNGES